MSAHDERIMRRLLDCQPITLMGDEASFDELPDREMAQLLVRLSELARLAGCHVQVGNGAVVMRSPDDCRELARFGSYAEARAWLAAAAAGREEGAAVSALGEPDGPPNERYTLRSNGGLLLSMWDRDWHFCLDAARRVGWQPAGAQPSGWGKWRGSVWEPKWDEKRCQHWVEQWAGDANNSYLPQEGQQVERGDAQALAAALDRAAVALQGDGGAELATSIRVCSKLTTPLVQRSLDRQIHRLQMPGSDDGAPELPAVIAAVRALALAVLAAADGFSVAGGVILTETH